MPNRIKFYISNKGSTYQEEKMSGNSKLMQKYKESIFLLLPSMVGCYVNNDIMSSVITELE